MGADAGEASIRGCRLWQMACDTRSGGRAALQEMLAACVSDFKACPDPEGAVSVLKLGKIMSCGENSLFFGTTDSSDLYLRGEVLKTLAYASAVLDHLVTAMNPDISSPYEVYRINTVRTVKCHPSPTNNFLSHFPDLELPDLKEHLENYAKAFQVVRVPQFHSFLHGFHGTGKTMILNWLAIFAGLNGNPVFSYDQHATTLTVYHPDGSIASLKLPGPGDNIHDINSIVKRMFEKEKWVKTPIVLWDPDNCVVEPPFPNITNWGPSFMATANYGRLANFQPKDDYISPTAAYAYYHNILPWSEQEMVNLFSLTHSRSDAIRMYHYYGGSMYYFCNDMSRLPQYTEEMEHQLQDLECLPATKRLKGNDGSKAAVASVSTDISAFIGAVSKLEAILNEHQLMDSDADADLQLLRLYVLPNATDVPASAYDIVMEAVERVRRWIRHRRAVDSADTADAEPDAEIAVDSTDCAVTAVEARLGDIVKTVIETMSVAELQARRESWDDYIGRNTGFFNCEVQRALSLPPQYFILCAAKSHPPADTALGYVAPSDKYNFLRYYEAHCAGYDRAHFKFMSPYVERAVVSGMTLKDPKAYAPIMRKLSIERHEK
jgi:hypothetical protein